MKDVFIKLRNKIQSIFGRIVKFFYRIFQKIEGVILTLARKLLSKVRSVKEYIFSDRKRTIAFIAFFPITALVSAGGYFLFRKHYSIHPSVRSGLYSVPKDTAFYAEIKNTAHLKEILSKSDTLQKIETSEAWTRFLTSFAGRKIGDLLYLVEVKSNSILEWKDFIDLFGDSIGYAAFKDGSYSVIAKTNLKSKFGLTIFESFKASNIPLKKIIKKKETAQTDPANPPAAEDPNNPPPVNEEEEVSLPAADTSVVSQETYESSYLEEGIKEGNLIISQVPGSSGEIYFVMVGDYLFISDSITSLVKTISSATNPSKKSILSGKEMEDIASEYYKEGNLGILYLNLEDTLYTPFLKPVAENSKSVSFLFKMESNLLGADIYTEGRKPLQNFSPTEVPTIIPKDILIAVYSNSITIKDYIDSLKKPGDAWAGFADSVDLFFQKGNLKPEEYFTANSASALVLHKFTLKEESEFLYPEFTIGYVSGKADDAFLKTIFKTGKSSSVNFLDAKLKTYKKGDNFYSPTFFQRDKLNWISSSPEFAEAHISTKNGNQPALSDMHSFKSSEKAPHHIFINWKRVEEDMDTFLIYGGLKSKKYTDKTISSDIRPLYEALNWIESIHISLGLEGKIFGKMNIGINRE